MTKYAIVFFMSMVPIVELRGAIPYSQIYNLPLLQSFIVAIIGNMLPMPFIYLFARKVLVWGTDKPITGKFFTWCLEKGEKAGKNCKKRQAKRSVLGIINIRCNPSSWYWCMDRHFSS